jgi:hypothetical protein
VVDFTLVSRTERPWVVGLGVNAVDVVSAVPIEARLRMTEEMHRLKHLLLYSTAPVHQLIR